jgi:hypothetical protein
LADWSHSPTNHRPDGDLFVSVCFLCGCRGSSRSRSHLCVRASRLLECRSGQSFCYTKPATEVSGSHFPIATGPLWRYDTPAVKKSPTRKVLFCTSVQFCNSSHALAARRRGRARRGHLLWHGMEAPRGTWCIGWYGCRGQGFCLRHGHPGLSAQPVRFKSNAGALVHQGPSHWPIKLISNSIAHHKVHQSVRALMS